MINGGKLIIILLYGCIIFLTHAQQDDFTVIILNKMGYKDKESIIPYNDLKIAIKRIISHDDVNPEKEDFYEAVIERLLRNRDINSFLVKDVITLFHGDNLQMAVSYVIHNQYQNHDNNNVDHVDEDEDSYYNRKRRKEQRRKKSDL